MINWYTDGDVEIKFSEIPRIGIRYILPSGSSEEIKSVKKYPFINKTNLKVQLVDKNKDITYGFDIPKGYCYDGASVPRFFWRVIGSPTDNSFLIAALVHDILCENHHYVMNDREFSTKVFDALLKLSDVYPLKRFFMKHSVNFYQKYFCRWSK